MWQFFKKLSISLTMPLLNIFQPKFLFSQNPIIFKLIFCKINFKLCFLKHSFHFCLRLCRNYLRVFKLGIFEKGVGFMIFKQNFFKFLIGLSPIWFVCICVSPLWHFKSVLRHFSMCLCIVHSCSAVLHAKCLSKCSSDIFVLLWTQMSSNFWEYPWLNLVTTFW